MKKYLYTLIIFCYGITLTAQNFTDTKGELQITNSGQATYTVPIAMPPSIKDVAPVINLVYSSGARGGIAGQGWSISSISNISRIATRKDIDGFVDGVDFDDNDKLALDGQRLLLKTGTYWADSSTYETEYKNNIRIELKIESGRTYFIVTGTDGSRTWFGSTGNGVIQNAVSNNAWYIIRHEDVYANNITYVYTNVVYNSTNQLYIAEIKFSGNESQGLPQLNKIVFNYVAAGRVERDFIKGGEVYASKTLDKVEVFTNDVLFRRYQMTRSTEFIAGYERVTQVQEFNGLGEASNPVLFEYNTTPITTTGSNTNYYNTLDYNDIQTAGDFDGDGNLDFVTSNQVFTKLFVNQTVAQQLLPFWSLKRVKFTATTMLNGKLNQKQSLVHALENADSIELKIYDFENGAFSNTQNKTISIDNHATLGTVNSFNYPLIAGAPEASICELPNGIKKTTTYFEGDFNGDGISEVLMYHRKQNEIQNYLAINFQNPLTGDYLYTSCNIIYGPTDIEHLLIDLNPNASTALNSAGNVKFDSNLLGDLVDKKYIADFNGDGKSDVMVIKPNNDYKIIGFKQLAVSPWTELEVLGEGNFSMYTATKQILFGDYNGDGKTDIMVPDTEGGQYNYYWHIYYANPNPLGGEFFKIDSFLIPLEYWPIEHFDDNHYWRTYYAMDVNKDGKSDIVVVERKLYKDFGISDNDTAYSLATFTNTIGVTEGVGATWPFTPTYYSGKSYWDSPVLPMPIASNFRNKGLNSDLVIISGVNNNTSNVEYIKFNKDLDSDNRLKSVTESNGAIKHAIDYKPMESQIGVLGDSRLDFYSSANEVTYPDIDIIRNSGSFLVSKLTATVNGGSKYQDFKYRSLIANFNYGSVGFARTSRSSWYLQPSDTKIWTTENHDPALRGATTRTWTSTNPLTVFSSLPNNLLSTKTNVFSTYTNPITKVYNVLLDQQITEDEVTKVTIRSNYTYDGTVTSPSYYGLQTQSTTNYYNNSVLQGTNTSTTAIGDYDNNPNGVGNQYYIGKPKKVVTNKKLFDATGTVTDERSSEENYTYAGPNITHTEKKGHLTDALIEDMSYDSVGNLLTKTVSMPTSVPAVAARTIVDEYEPTKRFVSTKTDHQGFVSHLEYNPLGQVTKSTNYMGVISEFEFDNWGKLTQSKTTGASETPTITTTDYVKHSDGSYKVTSTNTTGDNAMTAITYDVLGRVVMKTTKGFANGSTIIQTTAYDGLGRKWRESEPYSHPFSHTPKNTFYEYDYLHRPTQITATTGRVQTLNYYQLTTTSVDDGKTTSTTIDAMGNKIATTDPGGAISFSYYANGQLKETNYEGHKITIGIDGWGNKTSTFDPNAGMYTYEFDGFGQTKKETTPKGFTEYTYDGLGKLMTKKVSGDGTDFNTVYAYNPLAQLINETVTTTAGTPIDSYDYEYDDKHRLHLTTENTAGLLHTKTITFDTYGRVDTESNYTQEKLSGTNFANTVVSKMHYSTYNGMLYKISNPVTGSNYWKLGSINDKMQVLKATLGNAVAITNTYDDDSYFTSQQHQIGSTLVLNNTYDFDPVKGTLKNRQNIGIGLAQENFTYDEQDRLKTWTNPLTGGEDSNEYDDKGRITANNKLGEVRYNTNIATGIYRKDKIKLNNEGLAYYTSPSLGGSQIVSYTMFKSPIAINESNKGKINFEYNSHLSRSKMLYDYGLIASSTVKEQRKTKLYTDDGSTEVLFDAVANTIQMRTFIGGDAYSAVLYNEKTINRTTGVTTEHDYYLHRDYLGSILAITNEVGVVQEQRAFDAWGNLAKLVNASGTSVDVTGGLQFFDRGYTGHEHLQEVRLIHMNGRLYDPVLRSFLMPDNFVQQPENTQNYNRYAYCLNNPLKYTDPSGEFLPFIAVIAIGAAIAATTYTLTALFSSIPFTFGGLLKATIIGAASAAVTFGIGSAALTVSSNFYLNAGVAAVAHGAFQGAMTEASGGKFWSGFAAGALSSIAASAYGFDGNGAQKGLGWGSSVRSSSAGMVAFATVTGGASAELTGGNFWVGAVTGLTVGLLNHYAHETEESEGNPPSKYKRYFGDKLNEIKNTLEDYVSQKSYQALRWSFDSAETAGGLMEIGSVTSVLFTGGAATPGAVLVGTIGFYTSAFGTAGNIGMDLYFDKNLKSASYRAFKFAVSAGTGKVLGNYFKGFDGAILDLHAKFYENVVVPNIEQHFNKNYNKF